MNCLVIIGAKDEARPLELLLPRLREQLDAAPAHRFEVLVIDDGSADDTAKVAAANGALVLRNETNQGVGASLRLGYRHALRIGAEAVVTMDADGQHEPVFVSAMADALAGAEAVIASRYHPDSERHAVPLDRDLLNLAIKAQVRWATGWEISDPLSGFWAMSRRLVEFAVSQGRQERYGVHLEHLIKFWWLAAPRPKLAEIAHPAIYGNGARMPLLTREYSAINREQRIERAGTHTLHVAQALDDVRNALGSERVARELATRRFNGTP